MVMVLYLGIHKNQLRYFMANGEIVPLPEEQERLAKEIERLEAILRSQGIDPNQL